MGKVKAEQLECGKGRRPSRLLEEKNCTGDTPQGVNLRDTVRRGVRIDWLDADKVEALRVKGHDLDRKAFYRKVRRALKLGAEVVYGAVPVVHWSLTAKAKHACIAPTPVHRDRFFGPEGRIGGLLVVYAPCRACLPCLEHRRRSWIARTLVEQRRAGGRTWFVTLTGKDAFRSFLDLGARAEAHRARRSFDALPPHEKFRFRAIILRREVAAFLKRMRKGVGSRHKPKLRFVCVIEPHEDFYPHAHLLVMEQDAASAVPERLFRARWWPRGYAQAKLVEGKAAAYVSKYLAKDHHALVHASLRFGAPTASSASGPR